jgi:DNA ligase-1
MNSVIDILEALESDNSRLFKEELLERNRKNDLLKRIFVAVGDPYTNFYVNKFKMPKAEGIGADDLVVERFLEEIYEKLSTRNVTGNAAKELVVRVFTDMTGHQQKWCLRILLKNLRCGVQNTTINKIWPNTINKFSVQLAETLASKFEENKGIIILDDLNYPVRVEPKLDGLRCIAVKYNGEVTMFTRNGTVLETLPTIKSTLESAPWDNFVLDGECMGKDWNESASVIMSHKNFKDDSGIIYHVFDAMHFNDWRDQNNQTPLAERVKLIAQLQSQLICTSNKVQQVLGITATCEEEMLQFYSSTMEQGYEGVMIKNLNSTYQFKRTDSVLKLKPITTYEGVIIGSYEGRRGSKREGLWGGFEILLPNGAITRVGGGYTDKLKAEIGINPESWIGKIIEVEGQPDPMTTNGLTKDGRVRFPVFLRIRDRSDVDPKVIQTFENRIQK